MIELFRRQQMLVLVSRPTVYLTAIRNALSQPPLAAAAKRNAHAMGCATSKEAAGTATAPAAPAKPSTAPAVEKTKPKAKAYDTSGAASFVEVGGGGPAFHGLLAGGNERLRMTDGVGGGDVGGERVVHPADDAAGGEGVRVFSGVAMTMRWIVVVEEGEAVDVEEVVKSVFEVVDGAMNGWNSKSELAVLNDAKPGKDVVVSEEVQTLFAVVDNLHNITGGRFDPTCGVLKLAFTNALKTKGRPPLPAELAHFKHATGWTRKVRRKGSSVSRMNANTVVDLDGVTKGHCIDLIVASLNNAGCKNCYVDWSGDIRAVGLHPSGRHWRSAVMTPPPLQRLFAHWAKGTLHEALTADDVGYFADFDYSAGDLSGGAAWVGGALATSGDYYNLKKFGYGHIMRADTLTSMKASSSSVGSVAVYATTCAVADGLATAAMTFDSPVEAATFLGNLRISQPDVVLGYCVMGRGTGDHATSQFEQAAVSRSSSSSPTDVRKNTMDGATAEASKRSAGQVLDRVVRIPGRLTWSQGSVEIDSLTSCSVNPSPVVSFFVPEGLAKGDFFSTDAKRRAGVASEALNFVYMSGLKDELQGAIGNSLILSVTNVVSVDGAALATATIEKVMLGSARTALAHFGHRVAKNASLKLDVLEADFDRLSAGDQTKQLFRQLPSSVWVLTTQAAEGTGHALTATSLAVSAHASGLFSFNITHSSVFFAAFGGIGSTVTAHGMASGQKAVAQKFVQESTISRDSERSLANDALLSLQGVVVRADTVQDHVVVVARISSVNCCNDDAREPLLYRGGAYVELCNL